MKKRKKEKSDALHFIPNSFFRQYGNFLFMRHTFFVFWESSMLKHFLFLNFLCNLICFDVVWCKIDTRHDPLNEYVLCCFAAYQTS